MVRRICAVLGRFYMESCTQLKHLQFCVTSKTLLDCWTSNQGSFILFLSMTHKNTVCYFEVEKLVKKTALENSHNTREVTFSLNQHHFRASVPQFKALFHIVLKKKIHPQRLISKVSPFFMRLVVAFPGFGMWHHAGKLFLPPLKPPGVSDWVI